MRHSLNGRPRSVDEPIYPAAASQQWKFINTVPAAALESISNSSTAVRATAKPQKRPFQVHV